MPFGGATCTALKGYCCSKRSDLWLELQAPVASETAKCVASAGQIKGKGVEPGDPQRFCAVVASCDPGLNQRRVAVERQMVVNGETRSGMLERDDQFTTPGRLCVEGDVNDCQVGRPCTDAVTVDHQAE